MFKKKSVETEKSPTITDKVFKAANFVGCKAEQAVKTSVEATFDIALDGAVKIWWAKEAVKNRVGELNQELDDRIQNSKKLKKK